MISYILLVALAALIGLCIMRATKKGAHISKRTQREPRFDSSPETTDNTSLPEMNNDLDDWEIVPIIRHSTTESNIASQPRIDRQQPEMTEETIAAIAEAPVPPIVAIKQPAPEFIIVNVFADAERPYRGYELLQVLLTAGLRYGKMGIFHRHEEISGRGAILFSLASAVEPGKFDLSAMGSLSTPGLTLFMQTADTNRPAEILSLMLETAHEIIEELGGALLDEKRQPLANDKIAQWQAQLVN